MNTHGIVPKENHELQALFTYLNDNVVTEGTFCGDLQNAVDTALADEEWRNAVLTLKQDIEAQKEGVRIEAFEEGVARGAAAEQARNKALTKVLEKANRLNELPRALCEPEYKNQLLKEFGIE